jgi:hypothetical protein
MGHGMLRQFSCRICAARKKEDNAASRNWSEIRAGDRVWAGQGLSGLWEDSSWSQKRCVGPGSRCEAVDVEQSPGPTCGCWECLTWLHGVAEDLSPPHCS